METRLEKTLIAGALLLIALLVIAVNLLTIMVVLRTPQLRQSDQWQTNMYVLSLAAADTLVGAALVWMACFFIPETRAIIDRSYALCMSGVIVYSIFMTVSHVTLLVIALDRLCYIVYPFFYGRFLSDRLTKALIFTIWCLSAAIICTVRVSHKNVMTGNCKPFAGGDVYETIFLTVFLLLELVLSGACYLRIACVVRNQQRRIRTILQVTANISSKENDLLCRDNHTTSEHKEVTPKASVGKHMSVKEAPENGNLEPQTVLTFQDQSSSDITLQASPTCQDSSDIVLQSHVDINGVGHIVDQSVDVDVSLATCQTEKQTRSPSDTMICLQVDKPETGPVHPGSQVKPVCKPCCINQKASNLKKSPCVGMFVAINIMFSISWFPFVVYSNFFDKGLDNEEGAVAALMPVFINSLLNFVVYTWKNIEYRKAYKRLFITFMYCVLMRRT